MVDERTAGLGLGAGLGLFVPFPKGIVIVSGTSAPSFCFRTIECRFYLGLGPSLAPCELGRDRICAHMTAIVFSLLARSVRAGDNSACEPLVGLAARSSCHPLDAWSKASLIILVFASKWCE